jgi:hypothetical protein
MSRDEEKFLALDGLVQRASAAIHASRSPGQSNNFNPHAGDTPTDAPN